MDITASAGEIIGLVAAMLVAGLITGILAGLFGVGGGAVMVPVLFEFFTLLNVDPSVRQHLAVGTSLAVIIPTSIRSFLSHRARGAVDMQALRMWAIPVLIGVVAGTIVAAKVSSEVLQAVFAAAAALIALKMLLGRESWRLAEDLPGRAGMTAYGLGIGVLSALMGIGGGSFGNLIFTMHNRPIHQGVATSSGLGVLISIPGTIGFIIAGWPEQAMLPPFSAGYVSLVGILLIAPISVLAAPIGVRIAHGASKRHLEIAFGTFLLIVSARFFYSLV